MGDGKKRRLAECARERMRRVAVVYAVEVLREKRLVTINRLLCLAALCGWAATILFGQ